MYGMCMNNISISPFDRKRWIADADDCACKLFGNPSRLRQSLLRSAAPLICNGWQCLQQSTHICIPFFHEGVCHGVKKEGPPGGPGWASPHQISGEERIAAQEDRSARWPACRATA